MMRILTTLVVVGGLAGVVTGCATPTDGEDPADESAESSEEAVSSLPFVCNNRPQFQEKAGAPRGQIVRARAASHGAFDRFVVEFDHQRGLPNYHVYPTPSARFTYDPTDAVISLAGSAGLELTLPTSSSYEVTPTAFKDRFIGPTRFKTAGGKSLLEVSRTGDFEGFSSFGLGLKQKSCFRVYGLANPARLVIDVQNTAP